jgi:opacity protein-like surface antigen
MTGIRGISLLALALVASGGIVQAADLYGGRGGSLKDTYVPTAPACPSWYARIDGGYSTYDKPSVTELGVDDWIRASIDDTWSIGGGIGRYFTCNIRGDITADYRFKSDVTGRNANPSTSLEGSRNTSLESTVVLGNLYYDFDASSRFRPYIGVGLGGVYHSVGRGHGVETGTGYDITIASSDNWHVAGALMAGFSLTLRERLNFDAGYRFLYLGQASTGLITDSVGGSAGKASIEDIHAHEFRFGLRYDIR